VVKVGVLTANTKLSETHSDKLSGLHIVTGSIETKQTCRTL